MSAAQSEVRKRQILEKKSHGQLLALRAEVADKGERIQKLEKEMIEIQRVNRKFTDIYIHSGA